MSRKSDLLILSEQYAKVYEGMKVVEAPASGGDASAANMGPGGVIEVQPDGKYPDMPKKDENAENSQKENEAAFMQKFERVKEEGKRFFESLDGITGMTWDKSLPQGALEQLVDYMESGLSYQMASDIKAHLLRALQDVASPAESF
jgi:hypothetical protein